VALVRAGLAEPARSPQQCARLASVWTLLVIAVLALTSLALQPGGTFSTEPFALSESPYEHVPGHGWYSGITDSATIGGVRFGRGWSGPIIQEASHSALPMTASVWVQGSEAPRGAVPLLFVHLPGDSSAWLQIAKHGDDAELTALRRGGTWGLTMPSVKVHHAFRGRSFGDTSTLGMHAHVTSSALVLRTSGTLGDSSSLALTPVLGWALIQPIVTVQSPLAWVAQCGWLFVLLAPLGWCATRSARPLSMLALTGAVVGTALVSIPIQMALSPLLARDWIVSVLCLACGSLLARRYRAHHALRSASPIA
jgi:hypothetical protein